MHGNYKHLFYKKNFKKMNIIIEGGYIEAKEKRDIRKIIIRNNEENIFALLYLGQRQL